LLDYQRAIITVHSRKGSLLEYNNVYLAEGPWPAKAQFDAHRLARQRDASVYLNYGYTRPDVMVQGPVLQNRGDNGDSPYVEADQPPSQGVPHEARPNELPPPDVDSPEAVEVEGPVTRADDRLSKINQVVPTSAVQRGFQWGPLGLDPNDIEEEDPTWANLTANPRDMQGATRAAVRQAPGDTVRDPAARRTRYQPPRSNASNESFEDQPAGSSARPAAGW